ncbi:MAG TPA: 5'/3'-nucleotidase SurE [Chloroflexota bacterium]|jgi:5'-nucleotidase|nr:5'/3'-nucleotidase SurE [Chloroflexota bacterium]
MNILVTNDDGVFADGLYVLFQEMQQLGDVIAIAPATEQSAVGHAITLMTPLRINEVNRHGKPFGYAVNGTPADCVKLAVHAIMDQRPDVIVSGVNLGANIGTSVIYSGTVSAATEGTILGIPSIAVSLATFANPDFRPAAMFARKLAECVLEKGLPAGTLLNVNVPAVPEDQLAGVEVTCNSDSRFEDIFEKRLDPRKRVYYWQAGVEQTYDLREGTDAAALRDHKISVTPIHFDMTNHKMLPAIRKWGLSL